MVSAMTLLKVCVVLTLTSCVVCGLHVGAFNIQVFGPTKADKQDVMSVLAKIAARYDILLVQEVNDNTGQAIIKLLQRIKEDHGISMRTSISNRLGRTNHKEQYAFLYRADRGISVVDSFHFDDGDESEVQVGSETVPVDLFQREPYIVRFRASNCKVKDFSLVALHTMPTRTVQELKALSQVVQTVQEVWHTHNIMVLGDLNADCSFVPKKAWPEIALKQDADFWWAISDDMDTTVNANTDCAYDRFIIGGKELRDAVVPGSVQIFDFQTHYGLTSDQALAVSDHYPIELTLQDTDHQDTHSSGSVREGSRSLLDILKTAWLTVLKVFARNRADSEL